MQLLCPFEYGADPFKTQSDQKHHLIKKTCMHKQLTLAAAPSSSSKVENGTAQYSSSKDPKDDSLGEREANEKNNIRKTYLSNTKGLVIYKFRRLLRENNLHEVLVHGNGYCFFILYHHCTG